MDYDLNFISDVIKKLESEKRYNHTLGVQKEAYKLGTIFLPEKAEKLALAGLLHDITKDFTLQKQLELCRSYGIAVDENNIVPKLLHSKTGCEYAKHLFGDLIDSEIYDSINYHTTGRANMTLFEIIIYLADYIEEGRTFGDCVTLREYFYDGISKAQDFSDKLEVLRKTLVLSFDLTIQNLIRDGEPICSDTVLARNCFLDRLESLKQV